MFFHLGDDAINLERQEKEERKTVMPTLVLLNVNCCGPRHEDRGCYVNAIECQPSAESEGCIFLMA